jgi:hypothetical protein
MFKDSDWTVQRAAKTRQRFMRMLFVCEEILKQKKEAVVSPGFSVWFHRVISSDSFIVSWRWWWRLHLRRKFQIPKLFVTVLFLKKCCNKTIYFFLFRTDFLEPPSYFNIACIGLSVSNNVISSKIDGFGIMWDVTSGDDSINCGLVERIQNKITIKISSKFFKMWQN